VIVVLDADRAELDLVDGRIACPRCGGRLRPWAWARARSVRCVDGSVRVARPRRARCRDCRATRVLLPSWCQPRLADTTEVVGAALAANAAGRAGSPSNGWSGTPGPTISHPTISHWTGMAAVAGVAALLVTLVVWASAPAVEVNVATSILAATAVLAGAGALTLRRVIAHRFAGLWTVARALRVEPFVRGETNA
jgi:hypothetical protein